MNTTGRILIVLSFLLMFGQAEATIGDHPLQIRHQEPTFVERGTPFELTFNVPAIKPNNVQDAYVFYRVDGEMAFNQKKAALVSSDFKVHMKVDDKHATGLEYYFEIILNNGKKVTYPRNAASQEPVKIEIIDKRKSERERRVEATGVDYTILSPNPGATVAQNEAVIAITLFYDPAEIDTANSSFQMLVDGQDVTTQANASDYFYTYSTDNLNSGEHTATFKIQKPDTALTITSWNFSVLDPGAAGPISGGMSTGGRNQSLIPSGQVELLARNQQVGEFTNDALSGNVRLSGRKGNISYSAHGLLTTQEDSRLQPQNRFGVNLYIGDWLELEAGHVYPRMSVMTISGQRMQGLNAGLHIWDDAINLQFVSGKLRRGIDNIYQPIQTEEQAFGNETVTDYSLSPQSGGGRGTFERNVIGGRLGFGRDHNFNFGLNFLKVEDDTASISVINDFNSLMNANPDLATTLTGPQEQELQSNPDLLSVDGNPRPKGNFVAASDLDISFDDNNIRLQTEGAVSLLNQDISGGILTQETADDLGISLDQTTEDILDQLSWLIIINENMSTIPLRFDVGGDDTSAEPFFPTGLVATQSELGLNYFDNNLRIRYRWVGPGYNSLANSTVRKDIAGISITDRFQLFRDRIYLTVGYENLNDNVINNKDATTNTVTLRGNVGWYPIDQDLPRVSLSLLNRKRDNDVPLNNPEVAALSGVLESSAVQNFGNGDSLTTPNPRLSDTYQFTASVSQQFSLFGITHDASLNYSILNTTNEVFNYGDALSNSISLRVINRYLDLPLQTNVGFNINNTETTSGLTDILISGFNIGGTAFLFDNKLTVDASLAFTKNRTESQSLVVNANNTPEINDDYYQPDPSGTKVSESNSYIISAGTRYNVNSSHSFVLDFRYSNIKSAISSVVIPNDHLLQLRYLFNF